MRVEQKIAQFGQRVLAKKKEGAGASRSALLKIVMPAISGDRGEGLAAAAERGDEAAFMQLWQEATDEIITSIRGTKAEASAHSVEALLRLRKRGPRDLGILDTVGFMPRAKKVESADKLVPSSIVVDDGDVPHALAAFFGEGEAYVRFWKVKSGAIVIQSIESDSNAKGRSIIQWLKNEYNLPIIAVEVIPSSEGFWSKMKEEGLVSKFFMATGAAHSLERQSTPLLPSKKSRGV